MENTQEQGGKKKPMTHEERLALAAKLDKELDEFIAGLEKKRYTDGWPEDKWEEEMEKHPFFMTKLPEDGELPPLLEGIQQLKYDENENSPLDLAKSYKDDGNFNFKYKKYRMAIISYTEGLRRRCGDAKIEAQLYSNRGASHYHLGNFRSCLADCEQALKREPNYNKAKLKALQCCAKLKRFEQARQYANEMLQMNSNDSTVLEILSEIEVNKKIQDRDNRKTKMEEKKLQNSLTALKTAIESRKIALEVDGDVLQSLEFSSEKPVLENGVLQWPVFFLYPEYSMSDYIVQFDENASFYDHIVNMFSEPPPWDTFAKYRPDTLCLYYEGSDRTQLYPVDVDSTLSEVLSNGKFVVRDWKPSFLVLVKGSSTERNFLKNYTLIT